MHTCYVQIREILRTDLGSRQCTEGVNGSEEPETFFNAEDNSDNGNADAPATPDRTGIVTALGKPHPVPLSSLPCGAKNAAM